MIVGNDISGHQGSVNFPVYKDNTNFLIIKTTEGVGFIDPWFANNRTQARANNIPLGYYHFARPDLGNTPQAEAEFFCKLLDGDPILEGEVIALDYECPNQKQSDVDWCKQWLDAVSKRFGGMKPFIYLNQSQVKAFDWSVVVNAGYGLWLASYTYDPNNNTGFTGEWPFMAMQQWTSSQIVPGINGKVDGNCFFGDLTAFKKYGYQKPVAVPPPPPTQPTPPPTPPTPPPTPPEPVDPCVNYKANMEQIKTIASKRHWFYKSDFNKIIELTKV
jgi:lysozyme